jgi:hypothetical protein
LGPTAHGDSVDDAAHLGGALLVAPRVGGRDKPMSRVPDRVLETHLRSALCSLLVERGRRDDAIERARPAVPRELGPRDGPPAARE